MGGFAFIIMYVEIFRGLCLSWSREHPTGRIAFGLIPCCQPRPAKVLKNYFMKIRVLTFNAFLAVFLLLPTSAFASPITHSNSASQPPTSGTVHTIPAILVNTDDFLICATRISTNGNTLISVETTAFGVLPILDARPTFGGGFVYFTGIFNTGGGILTDVVTTRSAGGGTLQTKCVTYTNVSQSDPINDFAYSEDTSGITTTLDLTITKTHAGTVLLVSAGTGATPNNSDTSCLVYSNTATCLFFSSNPISSASGASTYSFIASTTANRSFYAVALNNNDPIPLGLIGEDSATTAVSAFGTLVTQAMTNMVALTMLALSLPLAFYLIENMFSFFRYRRLKKEKKIL